MSALPFALIGQAIPSLSRHDLEALTERLIDALDEMDGDPDVERNGDELDGTGAEDEECFLTEGCISFAGCPIADPDSAVDDIACDGETDSEPDDYADEFADPVIRAAHRRRIQRNRCIPRWSQYHINGRPEIIGRQLFHEPIAPTKRQLLRRKRGVPRYPRA